ncbi:MAG TPA: hypothetical protein VJL62_00620 [Thermodesulfobacteriota bacterium]|nr:hypothetical protein [Thermodesulfobacteriota bacterium]
MSHDFSKEFFAAYHAAVFEALGEDASKYNVKIGTLLATCWLKKMEEIPRSSEDFKKAIEVYFSSSFIFSDVAEMTFNKDGTAHLHVRGCDICPGNEILRNKDGHGYCPICHMVKSAMGRTLKKKVELLGAEKPGPVGECYLKYKID